MKATIYSLSTFDEMQGMDEAVVHLCTNGRHLTYTVRRATMAYLDANRVELMPCRGECRPESQNVFKTFCDDLRRDEMVYNHDNDVLTDAECRMEWNKLSCKDGRWLDPSLTHGRCFTMDSDYLDQSTQVYCLGKSFHVTRRSSRDPEGHYYKQYSVESCDHRSCVPMRVTVPAEVLRFCLGKIPSDPRQRYAW